jgi:hypothetical protein
MTIKIECDKRIRKFNIEFYDGFDEEEANDDKIQQTQTKQIVKVVKRKTNEKLLDLDDIQQTQHIQQEIIEKPEIEELQREPLVAQEMQKLEF